MLIPLSPNQLHASGIFFLEIWFVSVVENVREVREKIDKTTKKGWARSNKQVIETSAPKMEENPEARMP